MASSASAVTGVHSPQDGIATDVAIAKAKITCVVIGTALVTAGAVTAIALTVLFPPMGAAFAAIGLGSVGAYGLFGGTCVVVLLGGTVVTALTAKDLIAFNKAKNVSCDEEEHPRPFLHPKTSQSVTSPSDIKSLLPVVPKIQAGGGDSFSLPVTIEEVRMRESYWAEIEVAKRYGVALKIHDLYAAYLGKRNLTDLPCSDQADEAQRNTHFREFCGFYPETMNSYSVQPAQSYDVILPGDLTNHQVQKMQGNQIYLMNGKIFDVSSDKPVLFIIRWNKQTGQKEMFVSNNPRHTHASFGGDPVIAAGDIWFDKRRKITQATNRSGHYLPRAKQTAEFIRFFAALGCNLSTPEQKIVYTDSEFRYDVCTVVGNTSV